MWILTKRLLARSKAAYQLNGPVNIRQRMHQPAQLHHTLKGADIDLVVLLGKSNERKPNIE